MYKQDRITTTPHDHCSFIDPLPVSHVSQEALNSGDPVLWLLDRTHGSISLLESQAEFYDQVQLSRRPATMQTPQNKHQHPFVQTLSTHVINTIPNIIAKKISSGPSSWPLHVLIAPIALSGFMIWLCHYNDQQVLDGALRRQRSSVVTYSICVRT